MWELAFNNISVRLNEVWRLIVDWSTAHLLQIIIIIVGSEILYRILAKTISRVIHEITKRQDLFPTESDRKKRLKTIDSLINTGLRLAIFSIASIMVINEMGINTAPLIASAGIIGVALGFGAQSLIKDFMSGLFIITENQYRVGDVIEVVTNAAGVKISGNVEAITIRTTVIRDQDGRLHHIPNGNIVTTSNLTMNYAGLNEEVVVAPDTDIDKLEHVINHIGEELVSDTKLGSKIIQPPHFDRVDKLSGQGIVVKIIGKTIPGEQWKVRGAFYKLLQPALEKNHIKLPDQPISKHKK